GLFAGDELRNQVRRAPLLLRVELVPAFAFVAEVDVGRVPELLVALDEQPQRERVPVQPALAQRGKSGPSPGQRIGHRDTPSWTNWRMAGAMTAVTASAASVAECVDSTRCDSESRTTVSASS